MILQTEVGCPLRAGEAGTLTLKCLVKASSEQKLFDWRKS